MIDFMELIKETTKFRSEAQYLRNPDGVRVDTACQATPKDSRTAAWWSVA